MKNLFIKCRNQKTKLLLLLTVLAMILPSSQALAQEHSMPHEMQHGFVLSAGDTFGSHLVASGHHSRQAEILGELKINDQGENQNYEKLKQLNVSGESYFLFQAQSLDLPSLKVGQVLNGHIIQSQIGKYESKKIVVTRATFKVERILLNIPNPFFGDK